MGPLSPLQKRWISKGESNTWNYIVENKNKSTSLRVNRSKTWGAGRGEAQYIQVGNCQIIARRKRLKEAGMRMWHSGRVLPSAMEGRRGEGKEVGGREERRGKEEQKLAHPCCQGRCSLVWPHRQHTE